MVLKKSWIVFSCLSCCLLGFAIIFIPPFLIKFIVRNNLMVTPESKFYPTWKRFPTRLPTDFYFFNWTNANKIFIKTVKPKFEEVGPYRFMMDARKANITWNHNGTVTFQPEKFWYYDAKYSKRDLQDNITFVNLVALGTAHVARNWNFIVRKGASMAISHLSPYINITHTVDEVLFKGYPDPIAKMAKSFPFFVKSKIPTFDRFGWFYQRNGSDYTTGVFNTGTGINSTFGKLYEWNYENKSPYFDGQCGQLDTSTGENFDPNFLGKHIKIFSSDLCRSVILQYVGDTKVNGVTGKKYVLDDYMLDNGTAYPENKCSCNGVCLPIGVFNISSCRYGLPVFASLPHFYKADPYYKNLIEGSKPSRDQHEFFVIVEPTTGFPLKLRIRIQINVLLHSIPGITVYENVPTLFMPVLWFDQQMDLPENMLSTLKHFLNIPFVCTIIGIVLVIIGVGILLLSMLVPKQDRKHFILKFKQENQVLTTKQEESKLLRRK